MNKITWVSVDNKVSWVSKNNKIVVLKVHGDTYEVGKNNVTQIRYVYANEHTPYSVGGGHYQVDYNNKYMHIIYNPESVLIKEGTDND